MPQSRDAWRALVLLYVGAQFVILTAVAMLVYPGGAKFDRDSDRYLFFQNFFSDLGATETYSGKSNVASHVLLIVALGSVGLAMMFFSPTWRIIVARRGRGRRIGIAAQWLAMIAGLGFIGIAATPWNHVLDAHNAFVRVAFGFLLAYTLCVTAIQLQNEWPRGYTAINVAYLLLVLAYVVILFEGPNLDTKDGLELQVAAQKVIVYGSIVALALQAFAMRREVDPAAEPSLRS